MSLPLYQANEAISVAIQSDHFSTYSLAFSFMLSDLYLGLESSFQEISAKLRNSPNQLSSFDSMESIVEAFMTDYESSDDFIFVANVNANTGEEEVFQLHGVVSETRLPPVLKGNRYVTKPKVRLYFHLSYLQGQDEKSSADRQVDQHRR